MIARLFLTIVLCLAPLAAKAEERITDFDVTLRVEKDGDILVREEIAVVSEGNAIQRGIFRDLPRFYLKDGRRLPYRYDINTVLRDGVKEPYAIETEGNAYRVRIGDADVFLANGPHAYVIDYEVKNQVRYFDGYDEIYWNATGNYWIFGIDRARASIELPSSAPASQYAAYTGHEGASGRDYAYAAHPNHVFTTTRPLGPGEGLTVAIGFAKGVVDPPSAADARGDWWALNAATVVLGGAFGLIGLYSWLAWRSVGRDPPKGPVFARYEPPAGHGPAAVHYVYHRGLSGHSAMIASLVNLGIRKRLKIDVVRKTTVLTRQDAAAPASPGDVEIALENGLFSGLDTVEFGGKYSERLTAAYIEFQKRLARAYGSPYFRWNIAYLIVAVLLLVSALIIAVNLASEWTSLHTLVAGGLVLLTFAAAYFLPAPTEMGQAVRTEIEGFRLYLKTAEELQLNAFEIGSDAPPPMTVERYERFLPYAIALGVEKPWTEHFERLMPKQAADYRPNWLNGRFSDGRSLSSFNSALVAGISSGVSSALPQSSSSSGSRGGGSSGGGGGGGGGGGW
jgi:uncharacterized membrane protein YgcG